MPQKRYTLPWSSNPPPPSHSSGNPPISMHCIHFYWHVVVWSLSSLVCLLARHDVPIAQISGDVCYATLFGWQRNRMGTFCKPCVHCAACYGFCGIGLPGVYGYHNNVFIRENTAKKRDDISILWYKSKCPMGISLGVCVGYRYDREGYCFGMIPVGIIYSLTNMKHKYFHELYY